MLHFCGMWIAHASRLLFTEKVATSRPPVSLISNLACEQAPDGRCHIKSDLVEFADNHQF